MKLNSLKISNYMWILFIHKGNELCSKYCILIEYSRYCLLNNIPFTPVSLVRVFLGYYLMYCLSLSVARVKHSGYLRYRVIGKLVQSQKLHAPGRTSNLLWQYIKEQCMFIDFSKLNVQYSWCFPQPNARRMICSPLVIFLSLTDPV